MLRTLLPVLLLVSMPAGWVFSASAPTHFRKHHTVLLVAKEGERVTAAIECVSASSGYADNAAYKVLDPFGKLMEKGVVPVKEKRVVTFSAAVTGPYRIDVDPGMNAFAIEPSVDLWAVEISDAHRINVIGQARNLYFWVPKGLKSFTLKLNGEAAKVAVCDGTGAVVKRETIPLYKDVELSVDVPQGKDGCAWCLTLDLDEDQSIVFPASISPYITERPVTEEMLKSFSGGAGLVRFDSQMTPRPGLVPLDRPPTSHPLGTEDGLQLGLSESGRVVDVQIDGKTVLPSADVSFGGFLARDMAAGPRIVPAQAELERADAGLRQVGEFPGLNVNLNATYVVRRDHIAVSGHIEDATGKDRAISLYYALPVAKEGLVWWDTIDELRPIEGTEEYGHYNTCGVGANGKSSVYPFGGVSGRAGLALAIPIDRPCINRIACNAATQQLYTVFDFALTPATNKFPQRAEFRFAIYRTDPRWGLRAAAKGYYQIFPQLVEKRMTRDGGWVCWGTVEPIKDLSDFGFLYHWGPGGAPAVAYDDKIGIFSFLYNDSVRYFADLGAFPQKPDAGACTKAFEDYLKAPDARAFVLSRPANATGRRRYEGLERAMGQEAASAYLARCVEAVRKSAGCDEEGRFIVGYVINRKDWGPPDWWTGRLFCNPDPDIPGGYGQFLLKEIIGRTFADYRKEGGELDGVGLDNYFTNARTQNFRREHFAYVNYPLTFSMEDFRPVQVGDFALYEWVEALAATLHGEGKFLIANMGHIPLPFATTLLDIHGYEWNIERAAPAARTLAYHKPVVSLPVKPEHYEEPWIRRHVRFAFFPGGYGGDQFQKDATLRPIYKKYIPVIRDLAAAGWEPVTLAAADNSHVRIERFGRDGAVPMYFTVDNPGPEPATCSIRIDAKALGLRSTGLTATVRLCGEMKAAGPGEGDLVLSLLIPPQSTSVAQLAGK